VAVLVGLIDTEFIVEMLVSDDLVLILVIPDLGSRLARAGIHLHKPERLWQNTHIHREASGLQG
jgi:hypothetical protein